jgi:putative transposase
MVRRRGGSKRALGTRTPTLVPQWPNDRWSLDFVADQFIDGRRMCVLAVVEDCTRECLALMPPLPSPSSAICGTSCAQ